MADIGMAQRKQRGEKQGVPEAEWGRSDGGRVRRSLIGSISVTV